MQIFSATVHTMNPYLFTGPLCRHFPPTALKQNGPVFPNKPETPKQEAIRRFYIIVSAHSAKFSNSAMSMQSRHARSVSIQP